MVTAHEYFFWGSLTPALIGFSLSDLTFNIPPATEHRPINILLPLEPCLQNESKQMEYIQQGMKHRSRSANTTGNEVNMAQCSFCMKFQPR